MLINVSEAAIVPERYSARGVVNRRLHIRMREQVVSAQGFEPWTY